MHLLGGKVAIVTGASKGNGKAIAELFSNEGCNVVLASRSLEECESIAADLTGRYGTSPFAVKVDVTNPEEVARMVLRVWKRYDRIDILINNAGYALVPELWNKPFLEVGDDEFLGVMLVDLLGSIHCSREVIKVMMERRRGSIVNISSTPALAGYDRGVPYTVAKAGILGLTKHLAREYGRYNIRVNAVALGNIKTSRTYEVLDEQSRRELAEEAALGRWGESGEVAGACLMLASETSSFITGQTIVVDGGSVMT